MMPKLGGIEVIKEIRKSNEIVPLLILSAKDSDVDKAIGLGMGADDYLTKPFSVIELGARVQALLRRSKILSNMHTPGGGTIEIGNLKVNFNSYKVLLRNEEIKLTSKEFDILKLFLTNPNIVFTKDKIYEKVWNDYTYGDAKLINVHIRRLREKIEEDPSNPQVIKTVWGIGYKHERKV